MKRFWLATNNLLHFTANRMAGTADSSHSVTTSKLSVVRLIFIASLLLSSVYTYAQTTDAEKQAEYKKVITERVAKIVNTLEINDSGKYEKVMTIIIGQYFGINTIHEENKAAQEQIKSQSLVKEQADAEYKEQEGKKMSRLLQQHDVFITLLKDQLTETQVEKVKDGMTYRVFPITYAAYLDMLPYLTAEQKAKIYDWLKEARELAMDAESSDKKHAVFGKYKGRINNYLSAAGYDMKKEGEEWQKRIKEREAKKKVEQNS